MRGLTSVLQGATPCTPFFATLAQLVEQRICNAPVAGSSPVGGLCKLQTKF